MIRALTPSGASTTGSASTGVQTEIAQKDTSSKDTFLKLLVAQLKYQNPLSPMDGTAFVAQSAQFTMVEKMEEMSKLSNDSLVSSNIKAATEMVGRTIAYDGQDGLLQGTVTSARLNGGAPVLLIGTTEVPLELVREVRMAGTGSTSAAAAAAAALTTTPPIAGATTPATTTPTTATTPVATDPITTVTTV